jgi:tetratricopeptide (TPR) repeat protein
MTDKPKGPAKPFLGADDLNSELDAWDNMFDALHESGPAQPAEAPMEWPAAEATVAAEPVLAQPEPSHPADDFAPFEAREPDGLEEQMTLDRAHEIETIDAPPRPSFDTFDAAPDETDFSEVGTEGAPAALGEMLGNAPPPADAFPEEEDVYTSASRPGLQAADRAGVPPEDPLAPPPKPAPAKRTGPAIIRRQTPAAVPVLTAKPQPIDDGSFDSPFAESTRIASLDEMEARAQETRGPDRSKVPTAPPPMSFTPYDEPEVSIEEDYPDIEIGAESRESAPAIEPAPAPRRTVAHVVRRDAKVTAPPPVVRRESDPVIEIAHSNEPAGEDDFSDVAAAVGASEDASLEDMVLPQRRPVTPPVEIEADEPEIGQIDDHLPSIGQIDDHLPSTGQIDDHMPTTALPDEVDLDALEDAYVPLTPSIEADLPDELPSIDDSEPETRIDLREAPPRPPALMDLYPRVKTPTSVPPLGGMEPQAARRPPVRLQTAPVGEPHPEIEPAIDLDAVGVDSTWPEQLQPLPTSQLDEESAQWLIVYERELVTVDEPTQVAQLRVEAGRLSERLGDLDRARAHYDAALLADPRATAALRGLRRIARSQSDLVEATRHLEAEVAVAGALERRPLGHYRVDLLLASGEQDLARVAVGEILDTAPSDVRALLAQLELAFLDGRAEEFGHALEQLAHAVTDNELRAAVQQARAVLAAHHNDPTAAATWFAAAAESDPASLGARLGAIRQAVGQGDGELAARAMLDLARRISEADPFTTAALALRAQFWTTGEAGAAAAQLAAASLPGEPLVARATAQTALAANDAAFAGAALATWAASEAPAHERSYAAGRAAELDPARGAELWALAMQQDPGDDYAAAQLRTAHVAVEQTRLAIEVDLAMAADPERERATLRAAFGLVAESQLDEAIALLTRTREHRSSSIALVEALAEALAAAGRWADRAKLLAEIAENPPEEVDRELAQLRSALAWEEAVGAAATAEAPDADEIQRTTTAALGAWDKVLDTQPGSPTAHAAALVLAGRLGDRDVLGEALQRTQQAAQSPWQAASLAFRRARLAAEGDAADILRDAAPGLDDPRRTVLLELAAARKGELADAAAVLEERARVLGEGRQAATLRLRAAQLALDTGDAPRATSLLRQVEKALPNLGIVQDLLSAARRRAGDRHTPAMGNAVPTGAASRDAFAQIVRDADLSAAQNDGAAAIGLYQRALEMRPGDPLAALPLIRVATQLREPAPIAALALAQLRAAEAAGDGAGKAEAYELLARIDKDLRDDAGSAQVALESASQADPSRVDLMHRLEREYTVTGQLGELIRLRRAELEQVPTDLAKDRAALLMDIATLSERDSRPDAEMTELYRQALEMDPRRRMALLHLESLVRRGGASIDLAKLEEQIAAYFDGEPRTQAAFYTRAGETLAEVGNIDEAVGKFNKAETALPGHVPALEGWRTAALKGQLWIDVAEAANRQAAATDDPEIRAKLHHFAGVALMDKALAGEQAMQAFRKALEADPSHRDSFMRLRILLEEDANHDELAIVLGNRLEHEPDGRSKIEIHRALAELFRNFLSDRDNAKQHYREILAADPNDLRAHAAVADIAWEQGAWQEAADALLARARLERDPQILKTLCYRLGLIYAERLVDVPLALKAFQRALTYAPEDENTLIRLADLATQAQEWKLALGACERLVKMEQDPEKRASHLHRVARIFKQGFGDMKRAERALNLALDGAPTNDEALSQLVQFYRDAGDMTSVRVHLNRVAGTMRTRVTPGTGDPKDGVAYRVISRAMTARGASGVGGSVPIARAAAELAQVLGGAEEAERVLLADPARVDLAPLLRGETDEVLFPRTVQPELRQIFTLLGDRVAKHVGIDLKHYGVSRGDRLRAKDSTVAAHAQDVATGLGFGEIDVYVSARQPYAMVAEPTSPVSLVIGQSIAQMDSRAVRFAAGAALKLAQSSLAIPARLAPDDLGVLIVSLLRIFQPEFPDAGLDTNAIATQTQKLRRLIPTGLSTELRPFTLAIDSGYFKHEHLARDLRIAGLRAGLVASGSLVAGLSILAASENTDVPGFLANPVAQGLIAWALSEDHASVTR